MNSHIYRRLVAILAGPFLYIASAQTWTPSSSQNSLTTSSKVGIGAMGSGGPTQALEVNGLAIFGAGTQQNLPPGQSLITGSFPFTDMPGLVLYNAGGGGGSSVSLDFYNTSYHSGIPQAKIKASDDGAFSDHLLFLMKNPGSPGNAVIERMRITSSGNVGIGVSQPAHLLHVAGVIGAEQIIVSSTGADYVFDPGYPLMPLDAVADFIGEHHHLPAIPAAAETAKSGANLGDMQTRLLAKIEELTLYLIDSQKRVRELQDRVARLEGRAN